MTYAVTIMTMDRQLHTTFYRRNDSSIDYLNIYTHTDAKNSTNNKEMVLTGPSDLQNVLTLSYLDLRRAVLRL